MQIRTKSIIACSGILIYLTIAIVFRPYERPDPELVAPDLAALQGPFKEVHTAYYMDGGSYGIRITDRDGKLLDLWLPVSMNGNADQYQRVLIGSLHYTKKGAVEATNPYHTKLKIEEIIRSSPGFDRRRDVDLANLSGRWSDYWRVMYRSYILKAYKEKDA